MSELDKILKVCAELDRRGESAVLATVVDVKGSAYRHAGARMLITVTGERIGSISGGCLEGDLAKKGWWWTESGRPAVRVYDTTSDDDTAWEFGLGCNGVVRVFVERIDTAGTREMLAFVNECRSRLQPCVIATVVDAPESAGVSLGERLLLSSERVSVCSLRNREAAYLLETEARAALRERRSRVVQCDSADRTFEVFIEVVEPPVSLLVLGAGHDAVPLVHFARELGWHVTVAGTRASDAKPERFPAANNIVVTTPEDPLAGVPVQGRSLAVVMNHSYPVDRAVLGALLATELLYVGVLGPRARTERMLGELGIERPPANLHAPIGLDIGASSPEMIALSILAEMQAVLAERNGGMLRDRSGPINRRDHPARIARPAAIS